MSQNLLQTKLFIPPPQPNQVSRGRLLERLVAKQTQARLIFISAPAGFGKTSLVVEWIHHMQQAVGWLSLDEGDNEPVRFLHYLVAALNAVSPHIGDEAASLLDAAQSPSFGSIVSVLINELVAIEEDTTEDRYLVLDDYHLIEDQTIHHGIEFLLEHLPAKFHVVITSRTDIPITLSLLRGRGQLIEIRAEDLRFTENETKLFLTKMGHGSLSTEQVAMLTRRTEGWVTGLQLAILSWDGQQDAEHFFEGVTGRYGFIQEYLLDEVLSKQPPEIEQFLLHTSILGRISAELCNRVTQQVNSRTIIERIDAANLFLIPLDGKREWFRYHHLFSDLLQERLTQQIPTEAINTLHLQASLWFEEHRYIEEAIEHALTAQDFERAISLITPFGDAVLHGEGRALLVNQWARKIPDSHLHRYPGLTVSVVLSSLIVWDIEWAERNLKALPSPADLPPVHHAIYLLLQGNMALSFRNIKRARHLLMEAMAVAPEENLPLQLGIREQMITFLLNTEELLEARGFAQEGLELADAADHLGWKLTMQTILGTIALDRGQLYQAADICRSVIERVQRYTRRVTADTAADAHVYLGKILYEWNDLAGAAEHYHEAIRLSELGQLMSVAFRAYLQSLLLYTEVGESDQAATLMQKLTSLAERFTDRWSDLLAQNLQEINALLALRRGDLSAVARWTKSAGLSVNGSPEDRHGAHIIFAQYLIAYSYAKDDSTVLSGAVQLLQKLIEMAEQGGYVDSCINLRADLALAYYGLHNGEQAVAELEEALRLAQPEGYVRTFLDRGMPMLELLQFAEKQSLYPDYTSELLRAFEGETGKAVGHQDGLEIDRASGKQTLAALIEPLTEREEEVLQLIVDGLTNREIAEKLIISVATVKRHVYNIYGKLGVKHRGQAIAWVRERHL